MDIDEQARNLALERDDYVALMESFLQTTKDDLEKLDTALAENDLSQVAKIAHHIRGASVSLELHKIAEAAKKAELSFKSNSKEQAIAAARIIRAELEFTSKAIRQLFE
jgi:HPt (histidine-containing phosphotransfer) domain-containing protein